MYHRRTWSMILWQARTIVTLLLFYSFWVRVRFLPPASTFPPPSAVMGRALQLRPLPRRIHPLRSFSKCFYGGGAQALCGTNGRQPSDRFPSQMFEDWLTFFSNVYCAIWGRNPHGQITVRTWGWALISSFPQNLRQFHFFPTPTQPHIFSSSESYRKNARLNVHVNNTRVFIILQ